MPQKMTVPSLWALKAAGEPIVCVTAYDAVSGALADAAEPDLILVGDSVGNVVLGYETTVPVTLDVMLHHLAAVRRSVRRAVLVADMPFGSYGASVDQALRSAVALMQAGAEAVKLEGDYPEEIAAMVKAGIPVMGHVGMTPQSVHNFGGFKVQGRGDAGRHVLDAAQSVASAGAFSIVLELIPSELAAEITAAVLPPTIGIGAGPHCSGQIQVFHDLVGLTPFRLKHAKRYCEGMDILGSALKSYVTDTKGGTFPTE